MRKVFFAVWLVCGATLQAGHIPADRDNWSDYADAATAQADGWQITCGLSQQLIVSSDHIEGASSVGVQAIQSRWDKTFELHKSVSLAQCDQLRFSHKDSWNGRNVYLRIYMTPSPEEQAAGITEKRLEFGYQTATEWTDYTAPFASGTWKWNDDSKMWNAAGGNTQLTELVKIEWHHISLPPWAFVDIGDFMLVDGLHFVTTDTNYANFEELAAFCEWWLEQNCDASNDFCQNYDVEPDGDVDFCDFAEFAEKWLADTSP